MPPIHVWIEAVKLVVTRLKQFAARELASALATAWLVIISILISLFMTPQRIIYHRIQDILARSARGESRKEGEEKCTRPKSSSLLARLFAETREFFGFGMFKFKICTIDETIQIRQERQRIRQTATWSQWGDFKALTAKRIPLSSSMREASIPGLEIPEFRSSKVVLVTQQSASRGDVID